MHIQRQISVVSTDGINTSVADTEQFSYRLVDVLPKYILNVGPGEFTSNYVGIAAGGSYSIPLPAGYDSAERLNVVIRSQLICKIVIVHPVHGSSSFLVKSTESLAAGDHKGVFQWQGRVSSITVSVPSPSDLNLIDWFIWQIPDLDSPSSYMIGHQATGTVND